MNRPEVVKQIQSNKQQEQQLFQSRTQTKFFARQQQRATERSQSQENFQPINLYQYITSQKEPEVGKAGNQSYLPPMQLQRYEKQLSSNSITQNAFFGGGDGGSGLSYGEGRSNAGAMPPLIGTVGKSQSQNLLQQRKMANYSSTSHIQSENQSCGTYDNSLSAAPPQTGYSKLSKIKLSNNEIKHALQPSEFRDKVFTQKFLFSQFSSQPIKTLSSLENINPKATRDILTQAKLQMTSKKSPIGLDRLFTQQLQKRSQLQMQQQQLQLKQQSIDQQQQQQLNEGELGNGEQQNLQMHKMMRTAESFYNKSQKAGAETSQRPETKASQCSTIAPPESRGNRMTASQYKEYVRRIVIEPEPDVDLEFRQFRVKMPESKKYNLPQASISNNYNVDARNNNNNQNSSIQTGYEFPQTQPTNVTTKSIIINGNSKLRRSINITKLGGASPPPQQENKSNVHSITNAVANGQQNSKNSMVKEVNGKQQQQQQQQQQQAQPCVETLSCSNDPVDAQQLYLVIRNEYFDNCTSKNTLKYCYFEMPPRQCLIREKQAQLEYQQILKTLSEKLKFSANKLFLFLKDGRSINQHYEIPHQEITLILSASPLFKGLQSYKQNSSRLRKILLELEGPISTLRAQKMTPGEVDRKTLQQEPVAEGDGMTDTGINNLNTTGKTPKIMTFEKRISKKFQPTISAIISTLNEDEQVGNIDSTTLEHINNAFKQKKKKQPKAIQETTGNEFSKDEEAAGPPMGQSELRNSQNSQLHQNWDYDNADEYMQSQEILIKNKRIKDLELIDQYYQEEMQNVKFSKIEVVDEEQKDKNHEKIVNKIMKKDQDEEPTPIQQIANELGIIKQIRQDPQSTKIPQYLKQAGNTNRDSADHSAKGGDSAINSMRSSLLNSRRPSFIENNVNTQDSQQISEEQEQNNEDRRKQMNSLREQSKKKVMELIAEIMQDFIKEGKYTHELSSKADEKKQLASNVQADMLKSEEDIKEDQEELTQKTKTKESDLVDDLENTATGKEEGKDNSLEINFEEIEGDVNKDKELKKDFIKLNQEGIQTKKEVLRSINTKNIELCRRNVPQIMLDIPKMNQSSNSSKITNFTRFDIHQIYTMYKTLHQVTSQRYKEYNIDDGLDYHVYRNGLYQVFMQSEDLAQRIFNTIDFNYSGFMDWEEFLRLMVIIRAKTLKEKINLFIKIADEDGNGQLSKDEILSLAKVCLSKYIKDDESGMLDILCEYFTKLIFEAVEIDIEDEIPLVKIKKTIIEGNKESDLLCMFCGADI